MSGSSLDSRRSRPPPRPTTMAARTAQTGTRPEHLGNSSKRSRALALYGNLLPLTPVAPSFLSSFFSSFPGLSLSPPQIQAIYDELTKSVWVHGEEDMVMLWRRGFFGKGSLSRSEPSWKRRVENMLAESQGREKSEFLRRTRRDGRS